MILMFLSSCSWFGNRFGKDDADCPAGACDESNVTNEQTGDESWYCYGVQEDRSWDCGREVQPEKVVSIDPSAVRKVPPPISPAITPPTTPPTADEPATIKEPQPVEKSPIVASTPREAQSAEASPVFSPAGSEQGGLYILGQPADAFAVQLIAMQEEDRLLSYASHNGIGAPLYARIKSKDSNWYVLLLGTYADRQNAEDAKDNWESTRTLKIRPWVRKLGPLQDAIRLAQN